jgi:hypothetical protein
LYEEIVAAVDEGVAKMDAVRLKTAITLFTRIGNPAPLQSKLAEAFIAVQKMGATLGAEIKKALEMMPSREDVRLTHPINQAKHLVCI